MNITSKTTLQLNIENIEKAAENSYLNYMKLILKIILLALIGFLLGVYALAGTVTVTWDTVSEATSYEVFRGLDLLTTVTTNEATLTLPDDLISSLHVIAVSSSYRSGPSNILHVMPFKPAFSFDLANFESVKTCYATIPTALPPEKFFVRASFPVIK